MESWLINLVIHYPYLVYGVVAFVSFVEGPMLAMVCGLILRLGLFSFIPVYIALIFGDLFGDAFWYGVGYFFGHRFVKRFGKYFGVTEENISKVTEIFHQHKNPILFISKITMGLGFAVVTLITAGIVKIPFKNYLAINFAGQFIWTGFLLAIGYSLGNLYVGINGVFNKIFIIAMFIVVFFALTGYGRYVKSRFEKNIKI
jgi:membrane protein DedA with SNARE-associated domain